MAAHLAIFRNNVILLYQWKQSTVLAQPSQPASRHDHPTLDGQVSGA
jgi:hypothetical protein